MKKASASAEKLVQATQRVIVQHGIKGLTYRLIATEAGVPLGTATYHFTSIDELIQTAIRAGRDRHLGDLESWCERHEGADPAEAIVDYFTHSVAPAESFLSEYELYLAAVSVPKFRPLAAEWFNAIAKAFNVLLLDEERAYTVAAILEGFYVQTIVQGVDSSAAERQPVTKALQRLLEND